MAESIFTRLSRLLSATVEDSIDRMEQAGGDTVMREAIREADRAIDEMKHQLEGAMARRLQAVRQKQLVAKRVEELTGKAKFALDEGREDLAEAALSRQVDFEAQAKALEDAEARAREEEAHLSEGFTALRARKAQMEDVLSAYLAARREASPAGGFAPPSNSSPEKKVDAAEKAFDRAMGGVGFKRADSDTVNRVAEIDGLQKAATIAERLAALKAQRAA